MVLDVHILKHPKRSHWRDMGSLLRKGCWFLSEGIGWILFVVGIQPGRLEQKEGAQACPSVTP